MRRLIVRAMLIGAVSLTLAEPSFATGATPMDGTWGGADAKSHSAQLTVLDGKLFSVYLIDNYYDPGNVRTSNNGAEITFTVGKARAVFVRDPQRGHLTVKSPDGRTFEINLKKD